METNPLPWDAVAMLAALLAIVVVQWVEDARQRRAASKLTTPAGASPTRTSANDQGSQAKGG